MSYDEFVVSLRGDWSGDIAESGVEREGGDGAGDYSSEFKHAGVAGFFEFVATVRVREVCRGASVGWRRG